MTRLLIPLLLTASLAACSTEDPGRIPRTDAPADVTVSTVTRAPSMQSVPASVVAERTADVATRMSGTVREVPVDVGSRVSRGDVLLRLDGSDVQARISAARSNLELAERSHRRISNLAADGAASRSELDEVTARLAAARAGLREARAQEEYVDVRAPFSGEIASRSVNPGDLAAPGRPFLRLVAHDALEVHADVPAQRAGSLAPGRTVTVRVADVKKPIRAEISRVSRALASGSRTFRVEATLDDPPAGVLPGAYARMELMDEGRGPRWIPADAVVHRGQLRGVYSVERDTLRLRWVRLGRRVDGAVEVLAAPGDALEVVRRPAPDLHDAQPVGRVTREAFRVVVATDGRGIPEEGELEGGAGSVESDGSASEEGSR